MKKSSADDLRIAAQWLEVYEGVGADADACRRIRAWLLARAEADELRDACREAGVPVAQVRRALHQARKNRATRRVNA